MNSLRFARTLMVVFGSLCTSIMPALAADPPVAKAAKGAADSAVSAQDREFATKAAQAGHAEVTAGKLAASKASSGDVKKFATQMVDDHTKSGDELKPIAESKGIKLPAEPDAAHKQLAARLEKLQGAEFDRVYVAEAGVKDHKAAVDLFTAQAKNGKDPELKAFAQKTLPTVEHHYKMALDLAKSTQAAKK